MLRFVSLLTIVLLALIPAQGKGKDKDKPSHGKGYKHHSVARSFDRADRGLIVDYYRVHEGGLPPGLAKRDGSLPPGLEKQLRRNGRLPPGLEKRLTPFPPRIESELPPCPPEVRRGIVGGIAVMYNSRTGLILDAFALAAH